MIPSQPPIPDKPRSRFVVTRLFGHVFDLVVAVFDIAIDLIGVRRAAPGPAVICTTTPSRQARRPAGVRGW